MKRWLRRKFDLARATLVQAGVPVNAVRNIRIRTSPWMLSGRAYVEHGGNTVYISTLWAIVVMLFPLLNERLIGMIRHEIGHILVHRYPSVAKAFGFGEYPEMSNWYILHTTIRYGYGATCREEGMCEKIRKLEPKTIKKLVTAIQGRRSRA